MKYYEEMAQDKLQDLLGFRCDEADGELLSRAVTGEEIKDMLFAMQSNKSPCPDGFTCEFFQSSLAINSFFDTRRDKLDYIMLQRFIQGDFQTLS